MTRNVRPRIIGRWAKRREGRRKKEEGKGKGKEKRSEDIRVGKEQKKLRTLMVGHDAFVNEQRLSPNTSSRTSAVALPDMLNPSWLESAYVVVVEEVGTEKRETNPHNHGGQQDGIPREETRADATPVQQTIAEVEHCSTAVKVF